MLSHTDGEAVFNSLFQDVGVQKAGHQWIFKQIWQTLLFSRSDSIDSFNLRGFDLILGLIFPLHHEDRSALTHWSKAWQSSRHWKLHRAWWNSGLKSQCLTEHLVNHEKKREQAALERFESVNVQVQLWLVSVTRKHRTRSESTMCMVY